MLIPVTSVNDDVNNNNKSYDDLHDSANTRGDHGGNNIAMAVLKIVLFFAVIVDDSVDGSVSAIVIYTVRDGAENTVDDSVNTCLTDSAIHIADEDDNIDMGVLTVKNGSVFDSADDSINNSGR